MEQFVLMAKRLRELREGNGLSHARLSAAIKEKCGVSISRDSLMNYESTEHDKRAQKSTTMSAERLTALATFYGVSTDWLLGLSKDPHRQPSAVEDLGLSPLAVDQLLQIQKGDLTKYLNYWIEHGSFARLVSGLRKYMNAVAAAETYHWYKDKDGLSELLSEEKINTDAAEFFFSQFPYDKDLLVSYIKSIVNDKNAIPNNDIMAEVRFAYSDYQVLSYLLIEQFSGFLSDARPFIHPEIELN